MDSVMKKIVYPEDYGCITLCIHSAEYSDGYTRMDASAEGIPYPITVIRKDELWRAEILHDLLASDQSDRNWHNVLLLSDGRLDDCGGIASPCPCEKFRVNQDENYWAKSLNGLMIHESQLGSTMIERGDRYYGTRADGGYISVAKEVWLAATHPEKQYAGVWSAHGDCPYIEQEIVHMASPEYKKTHDSDGNYIPLEIRDQYEPWFFNYFLVKKGREKKEKKPAREKRIEREFGKRLSDQGIPVKYQVQCEYGIADIVTPNAIYEVKAALSRSDIHKATSQVLLYRKCINPNAKAVIVGCPYDNEKVEIELAQALGVDVILWEDS